MVDSGQGLTVKPDAPPSMEPTLCLVTGSHRKPCFFKERTAIRKGWQRVDRRGVSGRDPGMGARAVSKGSLGVPPCQEQGK